jgi:hypothetical protein
MCQTTKVMYKQASLRGGKKKLLNPIQGPPPPPSSYESFLFKLPNTKYQPWMKVDTKPTTLVHRTNIMLSQFFQGSQAVLQRRFIYYLFYFILFYFY